LGERLSDLQGRYDVLLAKDQDRFDALLEKQSEILDQRLGLNQPVAQRAPGQQTVQRSVASELKTKLAQFEAKRREEHWNNRIAEIEAADKVKTNVTPKENAK
jgi:hypothetical protein